MNEISILIADDHHIFRFGISQILKKEADFSIVGEVANADEVVSICRQLQPDIILMDISFPQKSGIQLAQKITQLTNTKILALTSHQEDQCVVEMLRAGASGYLVKDSSPDELIRAIRTIDAGHSYFSQNISKTIFENSEKEKILQSKLDRLSVTGREMEILKYVSEEMTNKEIAHHLFISPRTVETHKRNLMQKLNAKNVVGLAKFYFQITSQAINDIPSPIF